MVIKRPAGFAAMEAAMPFTGQRYGWVDFAPNSSSDDPEQDFGVELDAPLEVANIVTSMMDIPGQIEQLGDPMHRPVIDVDLPVHVVRSTTGSNGHLYIDHMMPWSDYIKLLTVMVEVGLVQPGYLNASLARGYTAVRLPWVSKAETAHAENVG